MIWNLTQHNATPDQVAAGVKDLPEPLRKRLCDVLTFEERPFGQDLTRRAQEVVKIAREVGAVTVMCGGAPFFSVPLEYALRKAGFNVWYAFSKRVSRETIMGDGTVQKTQSFLHAGFVYGMLGTHDFLMDGQSHPFVNDDSNLRKD